MKPKMILFDYGQTLLSEETFDGVKGTEEVLKYATKNKQNMTAQEVQKLANELNDDIGRYDAKTSHLYQFEIHNFPFQKYLYEYAGIELSISDFELEKVFWDYAAPGEATPNIENLLEYLHKEGIRSGVISNIACSGKALNERINRLLPNNHFEFIIASSDYVFRKPHKRIFDIALLKAELNAEEVWYCGDNILCDIEGASKCGIAPVWYTGALQSKQPETKVDYLHISNWIELIDLLSIV